MVNIKLAQSHCHNTIYAKKTCYSKIRSIKQWRKWNKILEIALENHNLEGGVMILEILKHSRMFDNYSWVNWEASSRDNGMLGS